MRLTPTHSAAPALVNASTPASLPRSLLHPQREVRGGRLHHRLPRVCRIPAHPHRPPVRGQPRGLEEGKMKTTNGTSESHTNKVSV